MEIDKTPAQKPQAPNIAHFKSVMDRAVGIARRRGLNPIDYVAQAIEEKNALEAGCTMDERAQGEANEGH